LNNKNNNNNNNNNNKMHSLYKISGGIIAVYSVFMMYVNDKLSDQIRDYQLKETYKISDKISDDDIILKDILKSLDNINKNLSKIKSE
jgi:hypothetical protein